MLVDKDTSAPTRLSQPNNGIGDVIECPSSRQQSNQASPSPSVFPVASQPSAILTGMKQDIAIKNPRPDRTYGHYSPKYTDALMAKGFPEAKAEQILILLQIHGRLLSNPLRTDLDMRFPILTLECKAYSTGGTAFEAENQAVVSGACMVNLQQQLLDLYNSVVPAKANNTPFAFSVSTEGSQITLWVHYAKTKDSVRKHYMKTLYSCDAALDDMLETFLQKWEQIMEWYDDKFFNNIMEYLLKVSKCLGAEYAQYAEMIQE